MVQHYVHFYRQDLISKEGLGEQGAAGQQEGGHRWEGNALALRAVCGYGTAEQQADWLRLGRPEN
jgi:hypothetical protein